jgi:hypothetical protein
VITSLARALAGLLAFTALLIAAVAPASRAVDVHGDEERDRYVGTGGLILPGSVDHSTRVTVAECLDCQWRLSTPCLTSASGHPFDSQPTCLSVTGRCPDQRQLLRAWFRHAGEAWREVGTVCIAQGGPLTVSGAAGQVRHRFVQDLAPPVASRQPTTGVVTQLPVLFDSGQHGGTLQAGYVLAGLPVALTARSRWTWDFGDGSGVATTDPGGRFPHDAVAHAYRRAGGYDVTMTTIWSARFTVDGLGPFEVLESITQKAPLHVQVGEGRAVLAVR